MSITSTEENPPQRKDRWTIHHHLHIRGVTWLGIRQCQSPQWREHPPQRSFDGHFIIICTSEGNMVGHQTMSITSMEGASSSAILRWTFYHHLHIRGVTWLGIRQCQSPQRKRILLRGRIVRHFIISCTSEGKKVVHQRKREGWYWPFNHPTHPVA